MKNRIKIIGAIGGVIGSIIGITLPYWTSILGKDIQEFLSSGTSDQVQTIEVWRNGINADKPEYVFSEISDISDFLHALRASTKFVPNHPQYDDRFDVYINRKEASRLHLGVQTGGAAGDEAVFSFFGGDRRSKELRLLFSEHQKRK